MIIGNMTLNSRPSEKDLREDLICTSCLSKCNEIPVDNSFDDQFGEVTDWGIGSSCCEGEACDGKIFLDINEWRIAKKDHLKGDRVIVKKGEKYLATVRKGYYIDGDGQHHGFMVIEKRTEADIKAEKEQRAAYWKERWRK